MSPEEAMEELNAIMAHAWMVRTFLKHADEIQEDEEMLEVPRMIFDYIRALNRATSEKTRRTICDGRVASCRSCVAWRTGSRSNSNASPTIRTSRWPHCPSAPASDKLMRS